MCGAAILVSYVLSLIVQGHNYLILFLSGTEPMLRFSQVHIFKSIPKPYPRPCTNPVYSLTMKGRVRFETSFVGFIMYSVALCQVSLRELEFFPIIVIAAMLRTHFSFIRYPQYGLSVGSVSLRALKL